MFVPAALWRDVSGLLDEALSLDAAARAGWLDRLRAERAELAPYLETLLAAHGSVPADDPLSGAPSELIASALAQTPTAAHPPLVVGRMLGPYRLVSPIGRGGMASVWLAEQTVNVVRRVALKLPSRALEDPVATAARFAQERDFLAGLEHAHIARLYDAGVSEDGQPYLAMEWIDGAPITRYADEHRLSLAQRVGLFLQVLQAVRHAHARLIIHRDIKPSNILVTPEGEVKLLDFGIARLLNESLPGDAAQLPGVTHALTPQSASPEQLAGEPLGTPSDVYSLGVVLYELLTGQRPYRLDLDTTAQSAAALHAALLDMQVPAPSTHAFDVASAELRNTRPARLRRLLSGDLDAIVAKALMKRASQRYESAEALAADLERYLRFEPVQARRRRWSYVAGRTLRKHRTGAAAAAIALLAVAMGVGGVLWQARLARDEARRATAIQAFLLSVFRASAPDQARGRDVNVKELMARGTANLEQSLHEQPRALAEIDGELGDIYNDMGDDADALKHIDRALAGFAALGLERSRAGINAIFLHAVVMMGNGKWAQAQADLDRCLKWGAEEFGPRNRWAVSAREKEAFVELQLGETDRAMQTAQLALAQPVGEDAAFDAWRRLRVRNVIGQIQTDTSHYAEARDTFRKLLDDSKKVPLFDVGDVMIARLQMARASHYEGDDITSLAETEALVPEMERVLGTDHQVTLAARGLLSQTLAGVGRYDDAIAVEKASLARLPSASDVHRAISQSILATQLKRAQRYAEALPLAQESLRFFDAQSRASPDALFVRRLLGEILLGAGRMREGTELVEAVREDGLKTEGFQSLPDWPAALAAVALARRLNGDLPAAADLLGQACTLLAKAPGPPTLSALRCQAERSWLLAMLVPRDETASQAFAAASAAYGQRFAAGHPARADLAMMQVELDGRAGGGSAGDRQKASALWQASMRRAWPGRLIELH